MELSPKTFLERYSALLPLVTAVALILSNRWFTEIDDEIAIIDRAARPVSETVQLFLQGIGQHEHPPLYDILLHAWLMVTNGNQYLLRVPSVICYALGAWTLAAAAKQLRGDAARICTLIILAVWPFGFHFARLATWYSFCFFLVSLLTVNYLRTVAESSVWNWLWLTASGLALIYANYFGWAFVVCLTLDYFIRNYRASKRGLGWAGLTIAILLVAYIPLFRILLKEVRFGVGVNGVGFGTIVGAVFNLYVLFVSESVAPWFWYLGIPAGIAIAVCIILGYGLCGGVEKRFVVYFFTMFVFMSAAGIMEPKRLLFISPWLVLPMAASLTSVSCRAAKRGLAASMIFPAAIGWFGIFARSLYAAPRWIEPWAQIARESGAVVQANGILIGNNPSFFFYLTYRLHAEKAPKAGNFAGFLPTSVRKPNVYDPSQWLAAGRPVAPMVELVKGVHYSISAASTQDTEEWLDQNCSLQNVKRETPDPGVAWKHYYAPQIDQPQWRVEIRTYNCQ